MRFQWSLVCLVMVSLVVDGGQVDAAEKDRQQHHKKYNHKRRDHRLEHHHHKHHHGHPLKHDEDKGILLDPIKHEVHMRKISWLNVPEVTGCHCRHAGEICIEGHDKQPMCVQEHHLQKSARLFKHYHESKEKAEEYLNEVDPNPRILNRLHFDEQDGHMKVVSAHNARQEHSLQSVEDSHGLPPKAGKHERERELLHHPQIHKSLTTGFEDSLAMKTCDAGALDEMRRRLTGWFHLLHGKEHHHHHQSDHPLPHHKPHLSVKKELRGSAENGDCECLKSVMWEFRQIDSDHDHILNSTEVKVIDNNDMEPCLHPYLVKCDANADGLLSRKEWCCCFPQKDAESPCYAKLIEIETQKNTEDFIPSCDHEGYYKKEQCTGRSPTSQTCWCVTPTGSEIPGSRATGRALCDKLDNMGYPKNMS